MPSQPPPIFITPGVPQAGYAPAAPSRADQAPPNPYPAPPTTTSGSKLFPSGLVHAAAAAVGAHPAAQMMRATGHPEASRASAAVILGAHHAQHAATRQHTGGIPGAQDAVPDTCWCGFRDDPECFPPARVAAKAALMPLALAAYPLGAALWAGLQAHFCLFSCCMMRHVRDAGWTGGRATVIDRGRRDTIDCWECQAKGWVWLDTANGNCWVCELPTTKRLLKGHCVEAPCQLCLWGETR